MLIRLIPVGNPDSKLIEALSSELPAVLNARLRLMPLQALPEGTLNQWRKQHDAEKILEVLGREAVAKFIDKSIPTLFVTNVDLYYKELNFIFGLEYPGTSSAIISIARLRPEFYEKRTNPTILRERVVKEAVHEIGHLLGLGHCPHTFCVMCFSTNVEDVDIKRCEFCNTCQIKLTAHGINV
jgi:archaemetzincin